jgi:NAD(P)H-dependent FMN reductase
MDNFLRKSLFKSNKKTFQTKMHITILSGSTRINRQSHKVALALAISINQTPNHTAEVLDLAAYNFPIFEEVLAKLVDPPVGLEEYSSKILASDAHIFVSPEYNGSYTAALKNAIDCLKRTDFAKKAIGVSAVSAGGIGGMRAGLAMQQLVQGVEGFGIPQMLLVGGVQNKFEEDGTLIDVTYQKNIDTFLQHFFWLAEAVVAKKSV